MQAGPAPYAVDHSLKRFKARVQRKVSGLAGPGLKRETPGDRH